MQSSRNPIYQSILTPNVTLIMVSALYRGGCELCTRFDIILCAYKYALKRENIFMQRSIS